MLHPPSSRQDTSPVRTSGGRFRTPPSLADNPVSVIGCVILLWDHLLTLGNEIKYIWKLRMGAAKGVFLFNRYFVEGALLYNVYSEFSGFSNA